MSENRPLDKSSDARASRSDLSSDIAVAFLRDFDPNGRHNITAIDPTKQQEPVGRTFEPGDWQGIADYVAQHNGRWNVYWTVNEPAAGAPHKKLAKADIGRIRAIVADVDPRKGEDLSKERERLVKMAYHLEQGNAPPSFIIDSGGGFQFFWKLADAISAETGRAWAEPQARGIAQALGGDAVIDISRVMRLPGTLNIPDEKKRAAGRGEVVASVISNRGGLLRPEELERAYKPAHSADGADSDATVQAVIDELQAANFRDVPDDLKAKFAVSCEENPALLALWRGQPIGGDNSGSGFRWDLSRLLHWSGGYTPADFAALCWAWDHAIQNGDDREDKLTPRQLARDWVRTGVSLQPDAFFEPIVSDIDENVFGVPGMGQTTEGRRYALLSLAQIRERAPARFLIERHVPENSLGFVHGDPGCGKSFLVLDKALHLAFRMPTWHGDDIVHKEQGAVVYIAGEGASGFKSRVEAWLQRHAVPEDAGDRFRLLDEPVNFMSEEDVDCLAASIREQVGDDIAMLIIDTVSRAMPGADENLQKEMTLFVKACDRIKRAFSCSVLGVHHAGKSGDMRGSTVLRGAGDYVFKLERKEGSKLGKLICEKQKDAADGWSDTYRFELVQIGVDAKGKPVTSLVPFRMAGREAEGAESEDIEARVLSAMHEAWAAGVPWSRSHQAGERYARRIMARDFDIKADTADEMLEDWMKDGTIELAQVSAVTKLKGLRVPHMQWAEPPEAGVFD